MHHGIESFFAELTTTNAMIVVGLINIHSIYRYKY